ncbi:uncharacterized protein LOC144425031 [Styela clava]
MKNLIVFILIYVITLSWCQDETVFYCSDKRIDENMHDKEFPITCKSMNATESKNTGNWFPVVTRNSLEIRENRNKITKQTNEIKDFRDNTLQQSRHINNLLNENKEQDSEIRDLRKDFVKFKSMNSKLTEELDEQKQTNNEMKKAMERIEQKLTAVKNPQQVQFRNQGRPKTKTTTTSKPTPPPENCELKIGNICYFAVIHDNHDIVYDEAVDICKNRNADIGLIRDEESYNAIMKYLRKVERKGDTGILIWTGIRFDPMTRDVTPADSFIKWRPSSPAEYKDYTYVSLYDHSTERLLGMMNAPSSWNLRGVICEIKI